MKLRTLLGVAALACASLALAAKGEFGDMCTTGLAIGKKVPTDCSTNLMIKGKTYCFGNDEARQVFLEDSKGMLQKAEEFYAKNK